MKLKRLSGPKFDRNRSNEPQIVSQQFWGERLGELYKFRQRIGFDDETGDIAGRYPDLRLGIPFSLNMVAFDHVHIMRAGGPNVKPVRRPYIRSGVSMPSRSSASSSCFRVVTASVRREAAVASLSACRIGQAA